MASPSGGGAKVKGSPRKGPAYTNAFKKWKSRSGNEESGALASCSPEPIPSCALCLYCFLQDDCPPSITIYTIYILALANGKCAIISITVINVYVSLSRFFFVLWYLQGLFFLLFWLANLCFFYTYCLQCIK